MIVRRYEDCDVIEINAISERYIPENNEEERCHIRVNVPAGKGEYIAEKGFRMIDRSIEVKVPLQKDLDSFRKRIRMTVEKKECPKQELLTLAQRNFYEDSRFYISKGIDKELIAHQILKTWVDEIREPFVCVYQNTIIGFADIRFLEEYRGNPFVYLAVIDKKYRISGAALSLYAFICLHYSKCGNQYLYGRISARNTAVMNLYASLGGQFMNPWDVYVR